MKGILKKTEQGWFVIYDQILGEGIVKRNQNALPLHPLDVKQIDEDSKVFDNIEARIKAYPDVEFEIETKLVFDRPSYSSIEVPKYAKLINKEDIKPKQCNTWDDIFDKIESEMDCVVPLKVVNYLEKYYKKPELLFSQTDEKGKPLTYWGGLEKPKKDDVWNAGLENEINKLPYTKHLDDGQYNDGQLAGFELGATWGYNKAKETLYTEFDIIKAFEHGWNQRHYGIDDEILLREIQNNLIKSLKQK